MMLTVSSMEFAITTTPSAISDDWVGIIYDLSVFSDNPLQGPFY